MTAIDKEHVECLKIEDKVVALDQIFLPPKIWAAILVDARRAVLHRLGKLGVKVEP